MIEASETESTADRFLAAICEQTGGDPGRSVSMWAAGEGLGFDRNQTENVAMELVSEGLLEVKSLSGGVSLTESGLARARNVAPTSGETGGGLPEFVESLEKALPKMNLPPVLRVDLELDARVLRMQLTRSAPLAAVVKAVLGEVKARLKTVGPGAEALLKLIEALPEAK
jgi:hypothetical protein